VYENILETIIGYQISADENMRKIKHISLNESEWREFTRELRRLMGPGNEPNPDTVECQYMGIWIVREKYLNEIDGLQ
jgi:hypothetical protein